jgi:hypothetical protein
MSDDYFIAFDEFGHPLDNGPDREDLELIEGATIMPAEKNDDSIAIDMERYFEMFPHQRDRLDEEA